MNVGPENIPKVQYLQCPAGVCIRHLEKFLCSKFSISPQEYNVDVIYEDKVLHKSFKLMDVVYCFNWKRVSGSLMTFFNTSSATREINFKSQIVVIDDIKENPVLIHFKHYHLHA